MKKQVLMFIAVLFAFQVSAQDRIAPAGKRTILNQPAQHSNTKTHRIASNPIWSSDFSNPADWTISNQAGNGDNWVIGTGVPSGAYAIPGIQSTTASNGFALFDSDLLCSGNQIADLTTAAPFSTTGMNLIRLQFEQQYARFFDSTLVLISTDGTNWTGIPVNVGLVNNDFVASNPDYVSMDISSLAANQATVWLRFEFYSPTGFQGSTAAGCGYAWMIDDVQVTEECNPPTVTVTPQIACAGDNIDLSITAVAGQTYQWETSADNITWTTIAGATGATVSATFAGAAYYRVVADCGNGFTTPSRPVFVAANPTQPLYCYCIPFSFTCNGVAYTSDVSIAGTTLTHSSVCDTNLFAGASNYEFVEPSVTTATLNAGTTYSLSVTTTDSHIISAWIDYDQSGTFDASEWTQVTTASTAFAPATVNITIPTSALNGVTGLRIRTRLATFANGAGDACINMGSGETEDYFVTISGGVGIAENEFASATVTPSVTGDLVKVDLGTSNIANTRLSVFDMSGRAVISNQIVTSQKFEISLGAFEAGMYIVRVFNGTSNLSERVTLVK